MGLGLLHSAFAQDPPEAVNWQAVLVAQGVSHPWGLTWLPDGRALVTSRSGTLHVLNGNQFAEIPLDGLPAPYVAGQGGLLDIALHPGDSGGNIRVYMTMSRGTGERNRTVLVRGVFDGARVGNFQVLFQVRPAKSGSQHFGSRLLWLPDGTLLMSVGDGGNPPLVIGDRLARDQAQNLANHLGKILRLTEDGAPAPGNPFIGVAGAMPEIWSYGHRNVQGLALDPVGRVFATEHGPRGGDELNRIRAGENYGWPLQSWGFDYRTGEPVGEHFVPGMKNSKTHWTPSIAPSGLTVYTGNDFPGWRGSLFGGFLQSGDVRRIALDAKGNVRFERRIPLGARVRNVQQGPDGFLYAITDEDNGKLYRIERLP
jgi:glucose/arabinose dehydrogenase